MQQSPESQDPPTPKTRISLLQPEQLYLPNEIAIPAPQLGAELWSEMISLTQADGRERATVISKARGGLMMGKIFVGVAESQSSVSKVTVPFLPHGIKSLLPGVKDLTYVHSHPKPAILDHIKTTLFSDGDIRSYDNSTYPAMVMIDTGGVHVLLRTSSIGKDLPLPNYNLHEAALNKAKQGDNTVIEAMAELALILQPHGIRYYYSPSFEPSPSGEILLKDVRDI